jgi:hypothetical protein
MMRTRTRGSAHLIRRNRDGRTRTRAREEAAPPLAETPKDTPNKSPSRLLKRKRPIIAAAKEATPGTPVAEDPQQPLLPTLPL